MNFGALVPENKNAFVYMLRGLFGGYASSYSSTTYFQQRHDYGDEQLRDLWVYRLNLSAEEVSLLVDHTWELQDARNTYYFLTRNCAYEFATLLSVVLGMPGLPEGKIWSTPADLFIKLSDMRRPDGAPLVAQVDLVASRQQDFRMSYAALAPQERTALRALLMSPRMDAGRLDQSVLTDLDQAARIRVLETALKYARFGTQKFASDPEIAAEARNQQRQLVLLRLAEPAGVGLRGSQSTARPPHEGDRTTLLQYTALQHSKFGFGTEIRLRPAYADVLSLPGGTQPFSGVAMGDLRLMLREDEIWLRRLDVLRVDALNPSPTGLPYDRANAWRFRFGLEDRDLNCDTCTVAFAEGGIGRTALLHENVAAAALLDFRGVVDQSGTLKGAIGPSLNLVGGAPETFQLSGRAGYYVTSDEESENHFAAEADVRLGANPRWDLRLRARYLKPENEDAASEIGLSFSTFF